MSTSTQTTITEMKTIKIFGIRYTYVPDKTYLKWQPNNYIKSFCVTSPNY
jgi:hypothetical protein